MPAKNAIKFYLEEGYYHIYNRGVEKRDIFQDKQDYGVFLKYLKTYLTYKDKVGLKNKLTDSNLTYSEKDKILKVLKLNNFFGDITLLAYCLMPNHFHLFIKQRTATAIDKFMQSLSTRYCMYFNKRYQRVGPLFQARYKALLVENDIQFLYLTKYIHSQSLYLNRTTGQTLMSKQVQPSSFLEYLGQRKTKWVHPEEILSFFSKTNPKLSYEAFVSENDDGPLEKVYLED